MIVVRAERYGGPEVLVPVEVPEPVPGSGQLLVRAEAIGVTFVDTQLRAGRPPWPGPPPPLPLVPGNGVAGVVEACGPQLEPDWLGRRVVTATGGTGGYAEAVVVGADQPLKIPGPVPAEQAVAMLADGRTALGLVQALAPQAGERVAVTAAAGGVGSLLVPLLVAAGAQVVALASAAKLPAAAALGAAELVDYGRPGWAAQLEPLDAVLDGVAGPIAEQLLARLRPGGRALLFGRAGGLPVDTAAAVARGVRLLDRPAGFADPQRIRRLAEQALALAAEGRLRSTIGARRTLVEAAAAHAAIEAREVTGKTVLLPG